MPFWVILGHFGSFWVILGHLVEFWLQKHHLHCIVKFKKNAPNLDFLCREQRLKSSGPCRAHRLKIHIKCSEFGLQLQFQNLAPKYPFLTPVAMFAWVLPHLKFITGIYFDLFQQQNSSEPGSKREPANFAQILPFWCIFGQKKRQKMCHFPILSAFFCCFPFYMGLLLSIFF